MEEKPCFCGAIHQIGFIPTNCRKIICLHSGPVTLHQKLQACHLKKFNCSLCNEYLCTFCKDRHYYICKEKLCQSGMHKSKHQNIQVCRFKDPSGKINNTKKRCSNCRSALIKSGCILLCQSTNHIGSHSNVKLVSIKIEGKSLLGKKYRCSKCVDLLIPLNKKCRINYN